MAAIRVEGCTHGRSKHICATPRKTSAPGPGASTDRKVQICPFAGWPPNGGTGETRGSSYGRCRTGRQRVAEKAFSFPVGGQVVGCGNVAGARAGGSWSFNPMMPPTSSRLTPPRCIASERGPPGASDPRHPWHPLGRHRPACAPHVPEGARGKEASRWSTTHRNGARGARRALRGKRAT
jgi:hypothetical protein